MGALGDIQNNPYYIGPPLYSDSPYSPSMLSGSSVQRRPLQTAQPQSGGGGMNPISAYNTATQFGMPDYLGIGSSTGSSAPASGAFGGASTGAEIGPSSLAVGGEGGTGSLMAAAGPWVALAAAIAANETWANKEGRRPEKFSDHLMAMLSGKTLEWDAKALGDKIGGPGGDAVSYLGKLGNPSGLYEVTTDNLRKGQDFAQKGYDVAKKPVEWIANVLGGLF